MQNFKLLKKLVDIQQGRDANNLLKKTAKSTLAQSVDLGSIASNPFNKRSQVSLAAIAPLQLSHNTNQALIKYADEAEGLPEIESADHSYN